MQARSITYHFFDNKESNLKQKIEKPNCLAATCSRKHLLFNRSHCVSCENGGQISITALNDKIKNITCLAKSRLYTTILRNYIHYSTKIISKINSSKSCRKSKFQFKSVKNGENINCLWFIP